MSGSYSSILPNVEQSEHLKMFVVLSEDKEPPETTPDAQTFQDIDIQNPRKTITLTGADKAYRVFVAPPEFSDGRAKPVRTVVRKAVQDPNLEAAAKDANDRSASPPARRSTRR